MTSSWKDSASILEILMCRDSAIRCSNKQTDFLYNVGIRTIPSSELIYKWQLKWKKVQFLIVTRSFFQIHRKGEGQQWR